MDLESLKNPKYLVFLLFSAGSIVLPNLLFWYNVGHLMRNPLLDLPQAGLTYFVVIFLCFLLFVAAFVLVILLHTRIEIQLVLYLLSALTIFTLPFSFVLNLIFAAVFFLTLLFTNRMLLYDLDLHTQIRLNHIFNHKLTLLIAVISALLTVQYYIASHRVIADAPFTIPTSVLDQAINLSKPLIDEQLKISGQTVVSGYLEQFNEMLPLLESIPNQEKLSLLQGETSDFVRNFLKDQGFSDAQIDNFSEQISTNMPETPTLDILSGEEVSDELFSQIREEVEKLLNNLLQEYQEYIPAILSLLVFVSLNSIGYLTKFIAILLAGIFLQILTLLNLIKKTTVDVPVERYIISSTEEK